MFKVKVGNRRVPYRCEEIELRRNNGSFTLVERGRPLVLRFAIKPDRVSWTGRIVHLRSTEQRVLNAMNELESHIAALLPELKFSFPEEFVCIWIRKHSGLGVPEPGRLCGMVVKPEVIVSENHSASVRYMVHSINF